MPKRSKPRTCEEELEHLRKKMRKLERKMSDVGSVSCPPPPDERVEKDTSEFASGEWYLGVPDEEEPRSVVGINELELPPDHSCEETVAPQETPVSSEPQPPEGSNKELELDTDVLEILGEDPSLGEKLGKDIRQELACRFAHTATEGLSKETRKELMTKYPTPANCLLIGAPKLNPEIKAAIPETALKRDKGIESKQTQMACAISCLAEIITSQLNSKDKDKEKLSKLMDLSRLLTDIQHGDSVTRKNFVSFALKKDLKEHLHNTKIDSFLFGEQLADTLKTAKSINKSGVELKADQPAKTLPKRPKVSNQNHLNRKAPGPAYRQPGPSRRSYEPAAPRQPPLPLQPAYSSRQWPRPQLPPPPPPPPPPPMQPMGRRRY